MRQRRNTVILTVSLAVLLFVLFLMRKQSEPDPGEGLRAVIRLDGETVHGMDLDTDAEYRVETKDGHYNVVVVKGGSVSVREADCPNQVCVKTAPLRNPGEVIACLPHRMIIDLEHKGN